MSIFLKYIAVSIIYLISTSGFTNGNPNKELDIIIGELFDEINIVLIQYEKENRYIESQLFHVNFALSKAISLNDKVELLIKKDQFREQLKVIQYNSAFDISKIRYLKGLQIIRILYEKMLSLDHHFASVATFNEINNLSNPNHYPDFIKLKEVLASKQDKKTGFNLTSILDDNIYTSVVYSLMSLFNKDNTSKQEKEESLKEVECILDFTLRMHNDLNTIYFETAFLQKSNDNMMLELQQLFVDFTKPIKYKVPIKECRNSDDWDSVNEHLNRYLDELDKAILDQNQRYKAHKMQINLEFPIDRLLQFITQYNIFIDQGAKFYEKFGIMLNSYENETQCATKIPLEYTKLKDNIKIAIEKFNTAYKPIEINGSKMKEVLYGINEFD